MKKSFPTSKEQVRRAPLFCFLHISLMFGLMEDSWVLSFPTCCGIWFWLHYRKINPTSQRSVSGKKNILTDFLDNDVHYSLILCQKSTINSLLNASYNLESETA